MNKSKFMSKLKIRNRILAIAVAFLLLTLMVPNAVFASESVNQAKDVFKEEVKANVDNAITVSGTVKDTLGASISGVRVAAFKDSVRVGYAISVEGEFGINCDETVSEGDALMLMVTPQSYAFEVIDTIAGANDVSIVVKPYAPVTILPDDDTVHQTWEITTIVGSQRTHESYDEWRDHPFSYQFPVGGTFMMTETAQLKFWYKNSLDQDVYLTIEGNAGEWYIPYYWGASPHDFLLKVNEPYTLLANTNYTAVLAYIGKADINFISNSEGHETFHWTYSKNDNVSVGDLASISTTTNIGVEYTVQNDGSISFYVNDSDEVNKYVISGSVEPKAKAGYKLANWTYNGKTLKAGDVITATTVGDIMNFEANYEVAASKAPATGDLTYVWVIAICALVLISGGIAYRIRKK